MKVNEDFVVRKVGDKYVAVALGESAKTFKGMIKLNATAKCVWDGLAKGETEDETVAKMVEEYDVTEEHAREAYRAAAQKMAEIGVICD